MDFQGTDRIMDVGMSTYICEMLCRPKVAVNTDLLRSLLELFRLRVGLGPRSSPYFSAPALSVLPKAHLLPSGPLDWGRGADDHSQS